MNGNIILVFFQLDVAPAGVCAELVSAKELHTRRAGLDYLVDYSRLPKGHVEFGSVSIEFPGVDSKF